MRNMPIKRPLPPAGKPPIVPLPNPGVRPPRAEKPPMGNMGIDQAGAMQNMPVNKRGMKTGGSVSSASKRADGVATKGKTRGKMC